MLSKAGSVGLGHSISQHSLGHPPALPSNNLEIALLKLVAMWNVVEDALVKDYLFKEDMDESGNPKHLSPTVSSAELKVSTLSGMLPLNRTMYL